MRSVLRRILLCFAVAHCTLASFSRESGAATITIRNGDPPDVGFNDPTPAAPVGGNPGTTVGEQRYNAVQRAADIWGSWLHSSVEILVQASWGALDCDPSFGFLGFAGPEGVLSDFTGAEHPNTWYPTVLANALAEVDLDPTNVDATARFNSEVGTANCLTTFSWYYGLDNNSGASEFDLVTTALHEIAHGLGFLDYVDKSTGQLLFNQIDAYSRWVFDDTVEKLWNQMTDVERAASAINSGNLVWNGPAVTLAAPSVLGDRPVLEVLLPTSIAGVYKTQPAGFGAPFTLAGLRNELVLVDDGAGVGSDACESIVNGAQIAGKIALIDRGGCPFVQKVKAAQDAGAIGIVVVNNLPGGRVSTMGGDDPTIVIPATMISLEDGNAIKGELLSGVEVTMRLDPTRLAGADDAGRVLLYAPNPIEQASSVFHWDLSATPDLLMEPLIPSNIPQSGDLGVQLFKDIGWPMIVPISIEYLNAVSAENGVLFTWELGADVVRELAGVGVERSTAAEGPYSLRTPVFLQPSQAMSYTDPDVGEGASYWYRLLLQSPLGTVEASRPVRVTFTGAPIRTALAIPLQLHADAPVEIRYDLGEASTGVRIEVYDVGGKRIRALDEGRRGRGAHRTQWDRLDARGNHVARGIYIVRLVAGDATVTKKAVLLQP